MEIAGPAYLAASSGESLERSRPRLEQQVRQHAER